MPCQRLSMLALPLAILLALNGVSGWAAPPPPPTSSETLPAPPPQPGLPSSIFPGINGRPLLESPNLYEPAASQPPAIEAAQPAASDRPLPINLATALCLSNARPLVIAYAQASVEEAVARLQYADVLWLPNFNVGTDYYRHDGTDMTTAGPIIVDDKQSFMAGGGATLVLAVTDAIFTPLAVRQEVAAREADLQTARNNALMTVAAAYFDVQQARGRLAGAVDAVAKAETLVKQTAGLSRDLVPGIEVDRAQALLRTLQQEVIASRASCASAAHG